MTNIVSLHGMDEEDDNYNEFLEGLKDNNANAIFLVEKKDGTVTIGCNFENPKDLVYQIYNLQRLAQDILNGGSVPEDEEVFH